VSPPFFKTNTPYRIALDYLTHLNMVSYFHGAMEECIYCGDQSNDWSQLRDHLKSCDYKKKIDVWRDEFKGVYGFYPSFTDVRTNIDSVRYKKETENA